MAKLRITCSTTADTSPVAVENHPAASNALVLPRHGGGGGGGEDETPSDEESGCEIPFQPFPSWNHTNNNNSSSSRSPMVFTSNPTFTSSSTEFIPMSAIEGGYTDTTTAAMRNEAFRVTVETTMNHHRSVENPSSRETKQRINDWRNTTNGNHAKPTEKKMVDETECDADYSVEMSYTPNHAAKVSIHTLTRVQVEKPMDVERKKPKETKGMKPMEIECKKPIQMECRKPMQIEDGKAWLKTERKIEKLKPNDRTGSKPQVKQEKKTSKSDKTIRFLEAPKEIVACDVANETATLQSTLEGLRSHINLSSLGVLAAIVNISSIVIAIRGTSSTFFYPGTLLAVTSDVLRYGHPGENLNFFTLILFALLCISCYLVGIWGAVTRTRWMILVATVYYSFELAVSAICLLIGKYIPFLGFVISFLFFSVHAMLLHQVNKEIPTRQRNFLARERPSSETSGSNSVDRYYAPPVV